MPNYRSHHFVSHLSFEDDNCSDGMGEITRNHGCEQTYLPGFLTENNDDMATAINFECEKTSNNNYCANNIQNHHSKQNYESCAFGILNNKSYLEFTQNHEQNKPADSIFILLSEDTSQYEKLVNDYNDHYMKRTNDSERSFDIKNYNFGQGGRPTFIFGLSPENTTEHWKIVNDYNIYCTKQIKDADASGDVNTAIQNIYDTMKKNKIHPLDDRSLCYIDILIRMEERKEKENKSKYNIKHVKKNVKKIYSMQSKRIVRKEDTTGIAKIMANNFKLDETGKFITDETGKFKTDETGKKLYEKMEEIVLEDGQTLGTLDDGEKTNILIELGNRWQQSLKTTNDTKKISVRMSKDKEVGEEERKITTKMNRSKRQVKFNQDQNELRKAKRAEKKVLVIKL